MKHILFLFCAVCAGFPFAAKLAAADRFSAVCTVQTFALEDSVCALRWQPVKPLSLYAGSLTYSGLWNAFPSASFSFPQALKQKQSARNAFEIQTASTGLFPLFCAGEYALPVGKISAFIGCQEKNKKGDVKNALRYRLQTGAGFTLPFRFEKYSADEDGGVQKEQPLLHGYWAAAWKRTYIDAIRNKSWFADTPPFTAFYANAFIHRFMLETNRSRFEFENGWAENPYGSPAFFIQSTVFQQTGIFLYNAGFFFCSEHYLNQNGSFEKRRIKSFFNPQLKITLPAPHKWTVRTGITTELFYENGWNLSGKAAVSAASPALNFHIRSTLPVFTREEKSPAQGFTVKKNAFASLDAQLYGNLYNSKMFTYTGSCGTQWSFAPGGTRILKSYGFNAEIKCTARPSPYVRCAASAAVKVGLPTVSSTVKIRLSPTVHVPLKETPHSLRFGIDCAGDFTFNKSALQKIRTQITLKAKYSLRA